MSVSKQKPLRLFLAGDVMIGRGIDQILPFPSDPVLYESCVRDARDYVRLAELASGGIPRAVAWDYVWGDALGVLEQSSAGVRIINLETSITCSEAFWPGKGIHYRMNPRNIDCLTVPRIDCCCLANNHVLDWGYLGLVETLRTLDEAGVSHCGAGSDLAQASAPAVIEVPGNGRVLVYSFALASSGVPVKWAATRARPGVHLLDDVSEKSMRRVLQWIKAEKKAGDVIVASIHWGPNWGYEIGDEERALAHRLIDHGVAVVYGHSSHHVKPLEMYRRRLVLYGCGDFINDYEGIRGHESYRGDLAVIYLADVDPDSGKLEALKLVPMQVRRFHLNAASGADAGWLCSLLNRVGSSPGTKLEILEDGSLALACGKLWSSKGRWPTSTKPRASTSSDSPSGMTATYTGATKPT